MYKKALTNVGTCPVFGEEITKNGRETAAYSEVRFSGPFGTLKET